MTSAFAASTLQKPKQWMHALLERGLVEPEHAKRIGDKRDAAALAPHAR